VSIRRRRRDRQKPEDWTPGRCTTVNGGPGIEHKSLTGSITCAICLLTFFDTVHKCIENHTEQCEKQTDRQTRKQSDRYKKIFLKSCAMANRANQQLIYVLFVRSSRLPSVTFHNNSTQ